MMDTKKKAASKKMRDITTGKQLVTKSAARKKVNKKAAKSRGKGKNMTAGMAEETDQQRQTPTAYPTVQLMPRSTVEQQELQERANILARPDDNASQEDKERELFIRFRLGSSEQYGIPYRYAKTVMPLQGIAIVPCTPTFIAGVVNHDGKLLTVIDPKYFFHAHGIAAGAEAWIIVVHWGAITVGILADTIEGDDYYVPAGLATPLASDGVENMNYVQGIHDGRVAILNMEALLEDPALTIEE
jgi:purine-binding chemotaxis protein CheW